MPEFGAGRRQPRAAQFIAARYGHDPMGVAEFLSSTGRDIGKKIEMGQRFMANVLDRSNVQDIREEMGQRMDLWGAHIRSSEGARQGAREARKALLSLNENTAVSSALDLPQAYKNYDLLMAQDIYLSAILDYIERGGGSRGSYLICHENGEQEIEGLPEEFRFSLDEGRMDGIIQEVILRDGIPSFQWKKVRPIPEGEGWFESVWNDYRRGAIFDV